MSKKSNYPATTGGKFRTTGSVKGGGVPKGRKGQTNTRIYPTGKGKKPAGTNN